MVCETSRVWILHTYEDTTDRVAESNIHCVVDGFILALKGNRCGRSMKNRGVAIRYSFERNQSPLGTVNS